MRQIPVEDLQWTEESTANSPVDYDKLPISWSSPGEVVDAALKALPARAFVIHGWCKHLAACLGGGFWSRGFLQSIMRWLARVAFPGRKR